MNFKNWSREDMIEWMENAYHKHYKWDKYSDHQLYNMLLKEDSKEDSSKDVWNKQITSVNGHQISYNILSGKFSTDDYLSDSFDDVVNSISYIDVRNGLEKKVNAVLANMTAMGKSPKERKLDLINSLREVINYCNDKLIDVGNMPNE